VLLKEEVTQCIIVPYVVSLPTWRRTADQWKCFSSSCWMSSPNSRTRKDLFNRNKMYDTLLFYLFIYYENCTQRTAIKRKKYMYV